MLLTPDTPRRTRSRATDAARRALVARYQRSDLTQRAFCAEAGLPVSTLQWWLVKSRREAARATPVTFAEIPHPDAGRPDPVGPRWAAEILTRTGVIVRVREPLARADLVALLRAARC